MKSTFFYFHFFLFLIIVLEASAQQNLFNIPSGDITPKNRFFYQHQLNIYTTDQMESKSHLVYGLGGGWDLGVNLVNVGLDFRKRGWLTTNETVGENPLKPIVLFTVQKGFHFSEKFKLNIGTQIGVNIAKGNQKTHPAFFHYGLMTFEPKKSFKIMGGAYYTNDILVGKGNQAGWMLGYELPVVKNKFYLMGDFISGRHSSAVSVVGFMVPFSKRIQFCAGGLLRNPDASSKSGFVLELNILGFDY